VEPDHKVFFAISSDAMCVINATHYLAVNPAMCKILGYSAEELVARPFLDFVYSEDVKAVETALHQAGELPYDCRHVTKTGKTVWVRWRHRGVFGQELVHVTGRDITDIKVFENDLGKYLIDLRRSKDEAEQFATVASHDLQEPLRTISNYASFMAEDYGSVLPVEANEYLGYIVDAAKQGRSLVNDLLALSRVGRDVHFGWVSAESCVSQATLNLEFMIREAQATVESEGLPEVWGDNTLLVLLFQNLVSNAVKFANGSVPVVRVGCDTTADAWHFWVQDNGIGIDPKYTDQVFSIFKRLDRSRPGTGIGLSICRKIVDLHRGRIWIDSSPGHGATVHFTVPKPEYDSASSDEHTPSGGSPTRRSPNGSSSSRPPGSVQPPPRLGWDPGSTVLAQGGALRDRPSTRLGLARFEPAQDRRLFSTRRSKV